MKNRKETGKCLLILPLMIMTLSACGESDETGTAYITVKEEPIENTSQNQTEEVNRKDASSEASVPTTENPADHSSLTSDDTESSETESEPDIRSAYEEALTKLMHEFILPDGDEVEHDMGYDPAENYYAICDVDQDGTDELIIEWMTSSSAGMQYRIYQYDSIEESFHSEYIGYPYGVTFYDNGVLTNDWSHNQGKGQDVWPYNISQYNTVTDEYDDKGSVDSWSKELVPDGYPENVDQENYGSVYDIIYEGYNVDFESGHYYSKSEYDAFRNSIIGGANEISIEYKSLSAFS